MVEGRAGGKWTHLAHCLRRAESLQYIWRTQALWRQQLANFWPFECDPVEKTGKLLVIDRN